MLSHMLDADAAAAEGTGGTAQRITLDGRSLRVVDIARLADRTSRPTAPDPTALALAERAWETADRLAATGRVYGRSTGVGANRTEDVGPADRRPRTAPAAQPRRRASAHRCPPARSAP